MYHFLRLVPSIARERLFFAILFGNEVFERSMIAAFTRH